MTTSFALPVCVYRFFDNADVLLYVGVTETPKVRWKDHAKRAWWAQVERYTVTWHDTRDAALREETQAIAAERPIHNVAGTARPGEAPAARLENVRPPAATDGEKAWIIAAWRAGMRPTEIVKTVGRSSGFVRKLRPDDVPPARLGGGAAPKRRRRKP